MLSEASNNSLKYTDHIISDDQRDIILFVNLVILSGAGSLFGSVANVINMAVYYRQGLDTTINTSFFSLAVSDLCSLVFQQVYNLFVNPLFLSLDLPIVYSDVQFLIATLPRMIFAETTCMITAFITAERCLCVVFPLHVKRVITPRLTATVIIAIYIYIITTGLPLFFTMYYTWKFYPDLNRTLLVMDYNSHYATAESIGYFTHALDTLLGFFTVLTCTLILIYKLGQKNEWRQKANIDLEKAKQISKRDRATIIIVVLNAGILVVCYTPAVILSLTTFLLPEFSVTGTHYNLFHSFWSMAMLLEVISSSVNIFMYYKMSSRYRQTVKDLLSICPLTIFECVRTKDITKILADEP